MADGQQQDGQRDCACGIVAWADIIDVAGVADAGNDGVAMASEADKGRRRTFHTLDLLRGIAAIAVAGRHMGGAFRQWMPGSHLAVDLFFVLSGFVIAHAYAGRLAAGLGAGAFMRIRLIRLYPLYLLGSLMGVAFAVLAAVIGNPGQADVVTWLAAFGLMLAFLPAPFFNDYQLYPFNNVSWSLIWELAINAVYAVIAPYLSRAWLTAGLIVGAILIVVSAVQFDGLDNGSAVFNWIGGPQRVVFSFLAGIAVYRVWQAGGLAWLRVPPFIAALILLAVFIVRPDGSAPAFDAITVLVVFPALVLAATVEPSPDLRPLCLQLGIASYAIYALHVPLVRLLAAVLFRLGESLTTPVRAAVETGLLLVILGLALLADRWVDRPARAWLSQRYGPSRVVGT